MQIKQSFKEEVWHCFEKSSDKKSPQKAGRRVKNCSFQKIILIYLVILVKLNFNGKIKVERFKVSTF